MKLLLAALLVLLSSTAQANLLVNGSFDDGLSGWTVLGPGTPALEDFGTPHGSCAVMRDSPSNTEWWSTSEQNVTLPAGEYDLKLTFVHKMGYDYAHVTKDEFFNYIWVWLIVDGTRIASFEGPGSYNSWRSANIRKLRTVINNVTVSVYLQAARCEYDGQQSYYSYIAADDFVLTATPVPEPGSIFGIVVGLVGLAGVVRRR